MSDLPVVVELGKVPSVPCALQAFAECDHLLLLESARPHPKLGRYSFLTANPLLVNELETPAYGSDPFAAIRGIALASAVTSVPGLPPFQGGFAGLLSYELGRCWEELPIPPDPGDRLPACFIGMYDWTLAWDHLTDQAWIIAQGDPRESFALRRTQAVDRCRFVQDRLSRESCFVTRGSAEAPSPTFRSNFSRSTYQAAVQEIIKLILAGDLFQANLSQRFTCETSKSPTELYLDLREHNSAPFAGFLKHSDWAVISSSPERFVQKSGEQISTRPIKGTRQRGSNPEADLFTRDELRESQKDLAENVMIVDLLRNDFSRVCRPGTVRVPELCSVEAYETVTHLVSEVTGQLRDGMTFWDVLAATFPGGSITGAPKIRAMEVITEVEQIARGAYCGSLFYYGFDGAADSSILIRTLTQRGSQLSFPAGGGVVAPSDPASEYEETLHKASGMKAAIHATAERSTSQ